MNVAIQHGHHLEWHPLLPGESVLPGQKVRPAHPSFPDGPQTVLRRVPSDPELHQTVLEIPDESFAQSIADYAASKGATTPEAKHLRYLLARHITDIVHEYHSPQEDWSDIVVTDSDGNVDETLSAYLKRRLVDEPEEGE